MTVKRELYEVTFTKTVTIKVAAESREALDKAVQRYDADDFGNPDDDCDVNRGRGDVKDADYVLDKNGKIIEREEEEDDDDDETAAAGGDEEDGEDESETSEEMVRPGVVLSRIEAR